MRTGRARLVALTILVLAYAAVALAASVSAPLVRFGASNASGDLVYADSYEGAFSAELTLSGLRPSTAYAFTLNGKVDRPGNDDLAQIGKVVGSQGAREGFLDFQIVRTDGQGRFRGRTAEVRLPPGRYDVKFFVKEVDRNWQVVLGLDVLQFAVQAPAKRGAAQIRIGRIVTNGYIEGTVSGLSRPPGQYKVVVYVRTDKWYIHPFTQGGDGLSFASVKPDLTWKIKTVKRDFAADEVVALLVDAASQPPATVEAATNLVDRVGAMAHDAAPGQGRL